jgi:integrase
MSAPTSTLEDVAKRSYGTGGLSVRKDARGAETWYGLWWVGTQRVKRKIGPKRQAGTRDGLTRAQAERELRRLIDSEAPVPVSQRLVFEELAQRYVRHLATLGRKRSTIGDYESCVRIHLAPFFGDKSVDKITPADVEAFVALKRDEGKATKSILNYLGLLHSIFKFAEKRGLTRGNPVAAIDKPGRPEHDADIRYLDQVDLEALIVAVPAGPRESTERTIYLTAAMTGLRQGELIALRWKDIDWSAGRIRVRQNYVRGEFGSPKSKRSSRSVPLADRVGAELERHFGASAYQDDEDLVFCHPQTGAPLDRSRLLKRFKAAAKAAGLRDVRFHDLRHTFGTRMAAAGVPLRTLQEWMGHRDFKTTLIYADYQPSEHERELVARAFGSPLTPERELAA